jgi:hypothetical protein
MESLLEKCLASLKGGDSGRRTAFDSAHGFSCSHRMAIALDGTVDLPSSGGFCDTNSQSLFDSLPNDS